MILVAEMHSVAVVIVFVVITVAAVVIVAAVDIMIISLVLFPNFEGISCAFPFLQLSKRIASATIISGYLRSLDQKFVLY